MKRYHEEQHIIEQEWYKRRFWVGGRWGKVQSNKFNDERGRYRKNSGIGCGNPRCQICHSDKYPVRIPTRQEELADVRMKEQIKDLN